MSQARLLLSVAALFLGCGNTVETSSTTGSGGASTTSVSSGPSSSSGTWLPPCQGDFHCPPPMSECQKAVCVNGVCAVENKPVTATCNGGCHCDGMGSCAFGGCVSDADCPSLGACAAAKCDACETCTLTYLPAGTPAPGDPPGNCQMTICDGMGQPMTVPDDSDVSDDGDPCTIDKCVNGVPTHQPKCPAPQTCNQGVCSP